MAVVVAAAGVLMMALTAFYTTVPSSPLASVSLASFPWVAAAVVAAAVASSCPALAAAAGVVAAAEAAPCSWPYLCPSLAAAAVVGCPD